MDFKYISIKTIINDFLSDTGWEEQVPEQSMYRWGESALKKTLTPDSMVHAVALIDIKHYEGLKPDGFTQLTQVGCIPDIDQCVTKRQVTQWVEDAMGCEMEINLNCPKCKDMSCTCSTPIIEVDANEIFRNTHPEHFLGKMAHLYNYGVFGETNPHEYSYLKYFRLMKPAHGSMWNTHYHLGDCATINFDTRHEYKLSDDKIIVNFKEGQVVMGYLKLRTDEEGHLLIPDNEYFIDAIVWTIKEKLFYRKFVMEGSNQNQYLYEDAKQRRLEYLRLARQASRGQSADNWNELMRKYHTRIHGAYGDDMFNYQPDYSYPSANGPHKK